MDVKELMIGDWVYGLVEDNEMVGKIIGKHPAKIVKLDENGDYSAQCPYTFDELYDGDGRLIDDFCWYGCEPIPITPEILEKNGFELYDVHMFGSDWYRWTDNKNSILFDISSAPLRCSVIKKVGRKGSCTYDGVIQYVHELQHALRLFGINKGIQL